jgi:hypothetical protein
MEKLQACRNSIESTGNPGLVVYRTQELIAERTGDQNVPEARENPASPGALLGAWLAGGRDFNPWLFAPARAGYVTGIGTRSEYQKAGIDRIWPK